MPKPSRTSRELRAQLHLLVVEDNKVNQEVALGILENLGYRADVAGDGYSALRALAEKDYDLILMDCQLPEMDGYETSRRIRQLDTAVRNHAIPIIAATAHAMPGDREKCLAAAQTRCAGAGNRGMDCRHPLGVVEERKRQRIPGASPQRGHPCRASYTNWARDRVRAVYSFPHYSFGADLPRSEPP
jgi:CheY-like chemotaxis protein